MRRAILRGLIFVPLCCLGLWLISQGGVPAMAAGGHILLYLRDFVAWMTAHADGGGR